MRWPNPTEYLRNPRVYHGTTRGFDISQGRLKSGDYGPGFYFTTNLEEARKYARGPFGTYGRESENIVYACDLEFQNPLYYHHAIPLGDAEPAEWFVKHGMPAKRGWAIMEVLLSPREFSADKVVNWLKRLGYDGIIVYLRKNPTQNEGASLASLLGMQYDDSKKLDALEVVESAAEADRVYYIAFDLSQVRCERA